MESSRGGRAHPPTVELQIFLCEYFFEGEILQIEFCEYIYIITGEASSGLLAQIPGNDR